MKEPECLYGDCCGGVCRVCKAKASPEYKKLREEIEGLYKQIMEAQDTLSHPFIDWSDDE